MSILELVAAFEIGSLGQKEFESALEQQMQSCQRRQEELQRQRVPAEDQAVWEQDLRPGLDACYEGLIGAAAEALEFARSRNQALLVGIAGLLQEVAKIGAYLEARAGLVSEGTRQLLREGLEQPADGLALGHGLGGASQGSAESQVSFLEES